MGERTTKPIDEETMGKIIKLLTDGKLGDVNHTWVRELNKRITRQHQPNIHINSIIRINQLYKERFDG